MPKTILQTVAVVLLTFALVACNKGGKENPDEILIGEISSVSGADGAYGLSAHRGILLAIEKANATGGVNGKKLKLVSMDSLGVPDESARAMVKLARQPETLGIITGLISSNALAIAPLAQQYRIPMISTISTHPRVTETSEFVFRSCLIDSLQGDAMAKFAFNTLKAKSVAILRDNKSDYSLGLSEKFISVFKEKGIEIAIIQTYTGGDIDFKAQLTAIRSKKPDVLYLPGYYGDVALIARQAKELGIHATLLGGDGWDSPRLTEVGQKALDGSYFTATISPEFKTPSMHEFKANFIKAYGMGPDGLAVTGYEGVELLIDSLKRAKSQNRADLREALAEAKNIPTLSGKLSIDSKRNAIRNAAVLRIQPQGKLEFVTEVLAN